MLATLCSKPLVMNVNMHQKMSMIFAGSLLTLAAIHTPRHTSQLASTERHSSCSHGRFIFVSTSLRTKALMSLNLSASNRPLRITSTATSTLPARLPSHVHAQLDSRSFHDTLPVA